MQKDVQKVITLLEKVTGKKVQLVESEGQLQQVTQAASDAFWQAVADFYPHIKTGDIAPEVLIPLENAMEKAIQHWVEMNG